ncbi:MAG: DegT/DnrJ/EryC1/StrS family aminotransferase [Spirochaetes bacterium]|nr:DegT/DnrJ/EryC1/StrS family aminotransferase [Spirochaetota bacterium]
MNQNINDKGCDSNPFIPFAIPSIGKEEEDAVVKVIRSNWLTTGKVTETFENEFAKKIGSKHAIAVNSATAGLHLTLDSYNLKKESFVITPTYTFTATAEVTRYLNLHPLFVDITEEDYNIDPLLIEKAIKDNKNVSAIIPVHISGHLCKMKEIMDIAGKKGIPVFEDAAHAFPVSEAPSGSEAFGGGAAFLRGSNGAGRASAGKFAGTFGDAGVFSFYATKTITTGEGGMIVTDNDTIARHMKMMRLHGIDSDIWDRYKAKDKKWYYEVKAPGFKYNLTDIASAIGIEQLKKADVFKLKRTRIAELYSAAFREYDFLTLPPASESHCWHLYIIRVNNAKLKISRDEFIQKLLDKGIGVSVHFIPLHIMPYYKNCYGFKPEDFPRSMEKYLTSISLPIYPSLDDEKVQYIIDSVIKIGSGNYAGQV